MPAQASVREWVEGWSPASIRMLRAKTKEGSAEPVQADAMSYVTAPLAEGERNKGVWRTVSSDGLDPDRVADLFGSPN